MRTVWKIVLSLIWPVSVMAQNPMPPTQPTPLLQSPPSTNDSTPGLDTTTPPSPEPTPIRPAQPPAFIYLRPIKQPPIAPGQFTVFNLSAGYAVANLAIPSSGRVALRGMDVSLAADSGRRISAKLDLSYTRAPSVFNGGHHTSAFSYLFGPVFSVWNGKSLSTYAHVLAGGARVTGTIPNASGGLSVGYVHYPAWAFGGSAEYRLSPAFGFRVTIDCLHTHFFNSAGAPRGQNDIRVVNSIVYYLGEPVRPRDRRRRLL